jgi:nucleoside-diphosphate-sugar epimerase
MGWTIVTGGAGFIGLNLVERLLSDGADVLLLDPRPLPARAAAAFAGLPGRLSVRGCDVSDFAALTEAVSKPVDRILHAAAITSDAVREATQADRIVSVNVGGAVSIARLAAKLSVPRVAFIGTAAIYDAASLTMSDQLFETSTPAPATLYGVTKYSAELILTRLAAVYGFSLVICRLGWMFGPWEHETCVRDTLSPIYQLTAAMMRGQSVNIARSDRRVWTYSRDAAGVVARLLQANQTQHEAYHVTPGIRLDLETWGRRLEAICPGASFRVGDPSAKVTTPLYAKSDGPLFASDRLSKEFDVGWLSEDLAFRDYCDWLQADRWPVFAAGVGRL